MTVGPSGWPGDLIENFMAYSQDFVSPEPFRMWAAIAMVGGALERRVWCKSDRGVTYGNLYMMLVAPPSVGKFIIEIVRDLWQCAIDPDTKTPAFKVAPDSVTKASLVDRLTESATSKMPLAASGQVLEYSSLLVAAEEIGVLLPNYDMEFVGFLNSIWNNKALHEETRRHGPAKHLRIMRPQLSLLMGVQPGWMASTLPEEAWSTGLTARLLMVYASAAPYKPLFGGSKSASPERRDGLLAQLGCLAGAFGQCDWSPEAGAFLAEWDAKGGPPTPTHSNLVHYNGRRTAQLLKLALIARLSRTGEIGVIGLEDAQRALGWLLSAEATLPDVFRAMLGKSDIQVIQELYYHVAGLYKLGKEKPVTERQIYGFLLQRVPSDKIGRIVESAERAGWISRIIGTDTYMPKGKDREVE